MVEFCWPLRESSEPFNIEARCIYIMIEMWQRLPTVKVANWSLLNVKV